MLEVWDVDLVGVYYVYFLERIVVVECVVIVLWSWVDCELYVCGCVVNV